MSILLFRVDERLIHGQVVVGWGGKLRPERFVVVDEELSKSEWEQDLYLLGVPEGAEAVFLTPSEAAARLEEWEESPLRTLLLTRDIATMLAMARLGGMSGRTVNLGGIHFQAGRKEILPYLFLGEEDRAYLQALVDSGVKVTAQDLPSSSEVGSDTLLSRAVG
jgi:PTS system mannose-specific IIB component/fructoselysine and glucoselysine-specific PTS system IIB component